MKLQFWNNAPPVGYYNFHCVFTCRSFPLSFSNKILFLHRYKWEKWIIGWLIWCDGDGKIEKRLTNLFYSATTNIGMKTSKQRRLHPFIRSTIGEANAVLLSNAQFKLSSNFSHFTSIIPFVVSKWENA